MEPGKLKISTFQIEYLLDGFLWVKLQVKPSVQFDIDRLDRKDQQIAHNRLAQMMYQTSGRIHRVVELKESNG